MIGDGIVRSFLAEGPQVSLFAIDTRGGGAVGHSAQEYMPRVQEQSAELDAGLADLSAFQQHGGKVLLIHGVADSTIPTGSSVLLYRRILPRWARRGPMTLFASTSFRAWDTGLEHSLRVLTQ